LHASSALELKERLEAERSGVAFLVYRDEAGHQRIRPLAEDGRKLTIGRSEATDVAFTWDQEVSSVHAELEPIADGWVLVDDGLSRNGTFANGERLLRRRRLQDGDNLRFGSTVVVFKQPAEARQTDTTALASSSGVLTGDLTPAQRRVLEALCRPLKKSGAYASPATNHEIATELVLSVDSVKTHMRALFSKFGVEKLPQNQKRARLAQLALESGVVMERDL
jgi:pSer/pThr/pTyr-binding forkhead associated (FHA) protein